MCSEERKSWGFSASCKKPSNCKSLNWITCKNPEMPQVHTRSQIPQPWRQLSKGMGREQEQWQQHQWEERLCWALEQSWDASDRAGVLQNPLHLWRNPFYPLLRTKWTHEITRARSNEFMVWREKKINAAEPLSVSPAWWSSSDI